MRYFFLSLVAFFFGANSFACVVPVAGAIHGYHGVICMGSVDTLTNDTTGGTWHSSNNAIATVNSTTGVVTPVMAGRDTITYIVSDTCGADTVRLAIIVDALPMPFYSSSLSVGSYTLFSIPAGTTMSAVSGAATWHTGTDTLHGASAGNGTFTITDSSGCVSYDTVVVDSFPVVGPIIFSSTLHGCAGNSGRLTDSSAGGTWSSTNTSVANVNATSGALSEGSTGTAIITYSVPGGGRLGWYCVLVKVDQVPTSITGNTHICRGAVDTLSTTRYASIFSSTVLGVQWTSSDTTIANPAPTTAGSVWLRGVQEGTITLTATSLSSGCSTSTHITVDTLPALSAITGTTTLCSSTTVTLSESSTVGVWSSSNTTIGSVSPSGIVTGLIAGTDSIIYKVTNSCGFVEKAVVITVNALPSLDLITGIDLVNPGTTTTLADGTTGGTWTSGNTAIATVDASGVVTGVSGGTAIISYTVTNSSGCTNYTTFAVDVVAPTGINNVTNAASAFSIYPNPAKGNLYISFSGQQGGSASFELKDITGRLVMHNNISVAAGAPAQVDLSKVQSGIYFVTISQNGSSYNSKLVVE